MPKIKCKIILLQLFTTSFLLITIKPIQSTADDSTTTTTTAAASASATTPLTSSSTTTETSTSTTAPTTTTTAVEAVAAADVTTTTELPFLPLQYSDLEEFREQQNRYIEMYNDFPKISYDTIHQILRDEDSGSNSDSSSLTSLSSSSLLSSSSSSSSSSSLYRRDDEIYKRRWDKTTIIKGATPVSLLEQNKNKNISSGSGGSSSSSSSSSNSRSNNGDGGGDGDGASESINGNSHTKISHKREKREYINSFFSDNKKILINNNNNNNNSDKNLNINNNNNNNNLNSTNEINNNKFLDLTNKNLTEFILNDKFKSLSVLNLTNNQLKNFTIIARNSTTIFKLKELSLRSNCIKSINFINLIKLNELEILDLSCNQISKLNDHFMKQVKNLRKINLSYNRLGASGDGDGGDSDKNNTIFKESFYNLMNIDTLILSHNQIRFIDFETFLVLPNLQYLDLSSNQIQGESIKSLQGIPDLIGLSIAYNPDLGDSLQEFVASWSLKELDASGTGLCRIPSALAQSVRTLKLTDNWLSIINCGDLDSYPLLQYLDLSFSHIDDIEDDALGRLEMLESLFLDHNNLKRLPISLPPSLENLFLHNNQITDIQSQILIGLHNLKILDLSNNKLLYLPGLPLPKLITLNLQSSELKRLSQSVVKTSPKLRDLLLDDNPIKCSDLLGIAEWTSSCHEENYDVGGKGGIQQQIKLKKDVKKKFQEQFNHFLNFKQSNENLRECCTRGKLKENFQKNFIPKCVQLKDHSDKQENLKKDSETMKIETTTTPTTTTATATTTHSTLSTSETVYNSRKNNISTNDNSLEILEVLSSQLKQQQQHNEKLFNSKKLSNNQNDETFTAATTTATATATRTIKFDNIDGNSVKTKTAEIQEENYSSITELVINELTTTTTTMTTTTSAPNTVQPFNFDNESLEDKVKSLPILSLTLQNTNVDTAAASTTTTTTTLTSGGSNDGIDKIKNFVERKSIQNKQTAKHEEQPNNILSEIKSKNNYVEASVLLNEKGKENQQTQEQEQRQHHQHQQDQKNDIKVKKSDEIVEILPKTKKNVIFNKIQNKNMTTSNSIKTDGILQYQQQLQLQQQNNNFTKNLQKIDESHIGKIFEKINDRRLYAASKFLKDKQFQPTTTTTATTTTNENQTTMAPLQFTLKDEQHIKTTNNSLKLMLDEINRSEIERITSKKYKKNNNNQMVRNGGGTTSTNIKKSKQNDDEQNVTTSATNTSSWSSGTFLSEMTTIPKVIVTTESAIKSTNRSIKIPKADKMMFANEEKHEQHNNNSFASLGNENVIIKRNQLVVAVVGQDNQSQFHNNERNSFPTTSKSITVDEKKQKLFTNERNIKNLNHLHEIIENIEQKDHTQLKIEKNSNLNENIDIQSLANHEKHQRAISKNKNKGQQIINDDHHNNKFNVHHQGSNYTIKILSTTFAPAAVAAAAATTTTPTTVTINQQTESNSNGQHVNNNEKSSIAIGNNNNNNDNVNDDNNSKNKNKYTNHHQDISIGLNEIESLMGDNHKDDYTNDDLLLNIPQSNIYNNHNHHHHQFLIDNSNNSNFHDDDADDDGGDDDDDDDVNVNDDSLRIKIKNSFNEFKKDTTEFIKLEHQHLSVKDNIKNDHKNLPILLVNAKNNHKKINSEISNENNHSFNDNLALVAVTIAIATATATPTIKTKTALEIKQIEQIHNNNNSSINISKSNSNNNGEVGGGAGGVGGNSKILSALKETAQTTNVHKISHNRNFASNDNNDGINENENGHENGNENGNGLSPEQWLEIRSNNQKKTSHPGLFIVIGITFGLIFFLGIVHIYRCHRKPLWYYNNQRQQHHHSHHHTTNEDQENYIFENNCNKRHQNNELKLKNCSKRNSNNSIERNYCCQCNENDNDNNYYIEMSDQNIIGQSVSSSSASSSSRTRTAATVQQHRNLLPLELLKSSRIDLNVCNNADNGGGHDDDDDDELNSQLSTKNNNNNSPFGRIKSDNGRRHW